MAKVSVIVPVYKTPESYLSVCIESVLQQGFDDFELILVDDGSPDGCPGVCDEYAEKCTKVKVLHQENKGVSSARNYGLSFASGRYVVFLDADDSFREGALDQLYRTAERNVSDIVLFDYEQRGMRFSLYADDVTRLNDVQFSRIFDSTIVPERNQGILLCGVCCKFYRNEFLKKNKLKFSENLTSAEDQVFFLKCLKANPSVSYCHQPFYEYRYVEKSASFSYTQNFHKQVLEYFEELRNIVGDEKEILISTRMCQCILYTLSKEFFHKENLTSIKERKRDFVNFMNDEFCQHAMQNYRKENFLFSERIGLILCRCRLYGVIYLASRTW